MTDLEDSTDDVVVGQLEAALRGDGVGGLDERSVSDLVAGSAEDMINVLGDAPSAVLLVDLQTREVVHADPVAQQLAPGVGLPARLDAWSDAAGLRDLDGGLLSETDHPLSRVARAEPVTGQAVSAARSSDLGAQRQPLWVIAIPMHDTPVLDGHALVVMLPLQLREAAEEARRSGGLGGPDHDDLRSRAVLATGLSFTVADATDPDLPLVWVNPAFTATTGYSLEESLGRNCRFLQGALTDPAEPRRIRHALQRGRAITSTLLNYRKDGTAYWNQVAMSPIHGPDGTLTHYVGIQTDVSGRIEADRARDEALEIAQQARAEAEAAEARLQLMADASAQLAGTLDVAEGRQRLLDLLVPRVADLVVLVHVDESGRVTSGTSEHADPARREQLAELTRDLPAALVEGPAAEVLLGPGGRRLLRDLDTDAGDAVRRDHVADESFMARTKDLGRSAVFVPLPGHDGASDVLAVARGAERDQFDEGDLEVLADLGRRAGLILENARLYQTQRHIAETLQRSLLSDLPVIEGIRSAARYHAGSAGAEVGGDFYDLTRLDDGTVALSVGDVVGHDVLAAAAMGHLKGLLRACVHHDGALPSSILECVDELLDGLGMQTIASLLQAFAVPGDDAWTVTWSSGGHPPLVVRYPDGRAELLEPRTGRNDPLIGLTPVTRRDHSVTVPHGTVVIGYTDGLIERRRESIDLGLQRLLHQVRVGPASPTGLVEHLVETLAGHDDHDHDDDVAVVAIALGTAR